MTRGGPPDLATLQRWMAILVRHDEDAAAGARTEEARALIPLARVLRGEIVRPSATMQPLERIDVYNGGYLARLVEALESDHPGLRYALGEEGFFSLVRGYVLRHPSRHPNLNQLGRHLPDYIAGRTDLEHRAFLVDLARLERAMAEAFDAPEFAPLDATALRGLSESEWAGVTLEPNPSVRLLALDHPANRYLQAVFDEKSPDIPPPEPSWVVVYRKDDRVWRLGLPQAMYDVLAAIAAGAPLGEALAAGGEHHEDEDVAAWFAEWSADGLFAAARPAR